MHIDRTYVAATAAVLSAIISPFVSWRIAKSTLSANKISSERQALLAASLKLADFRQAWINSLRDSLVELQAACIVPLSHIKANTDYDGKPDEALRIVAKIELLLNRKDDYYGGLVEAILRFQEALTNEQKRQRRGELVNYCQDILKTEWDRLKAEVKMII
jgi:hypothetical protein